jgi:glucose-1-phosphate thymidylyltransferase
MKGIVLAGGTGSRLWPITLAISKQLIPVYDKPMVFYPISTLMLAGIREVLIITTAKDQSQFMELLGDGSNFGISVEYAIQAEPKGLAQALIIGQEFLSGDSCLLILGDNIFHGAGLGQELQNSIPTSGAHIFTYAVANPEQYGVLTLSKEGHPAAIIEKPQNSKSNLAITGLYYFDERASHFAANVKPSKRGELEITSVLEKFLELGELTVTSLSRGTAWLDTGSIDGLQNASTYIRVIEQRTGLKIGCIEEIALTMNWMDKEKLYQRATVMNNDYGKYLLGLLQK